MLETVRGFASEKLASSVDRAETEQRHTRWLLGLSHEFLDAGPEKLNALLERFDHERPNLRAALQRVIEAGDVPTAALLLRNTYGYFARRDAEREMTTWVDRALSVAAGAPAQARGRLLILRAMLAGLFGELSAVGPLVDEGRRLLSCDDDEGSSHGYDLAFAAVAGIYAAMSDGSVDRAARSAEEALTRFIALHQLLGQAFMQLAVGDLALVRGDHATAEQRYAEAALVAGRLGDEALIGQALSQRGLALLEGGDVDGARRSVLDGAAANRRGGMPTGIAYSLEGLAAVALRQGRTTAAAQALAASAAVRAHLATPLAPALPPLVDRLVTRAREQLGEEAYGRAAAEGAQWPAREALTRILDEVDDLADAAAPALS
jgi:hypothetical protein